MWRSKALAPKWSDLNTKTPQESIRRAISTEGWTKTKTTKTGNARVVGTTTLKVLTAYKVTRAEVSFESARADGCVFGDADGQPKVGACPISRP